MWWAEGAYKVMRDDPVPAADAGRRPHRRGAERVRAVPDRPQSDDAARRRPGRGLRPLTNEKGGTIGPTGMTICHVGYVEGDHADGRARPSGLVARSRCRPTDGPVHGAPRARTILSGSRSGSRRTPRPGSTRARSGSAPRAGPAASRSSSASGGSRSPNDRPCGPRSACPRATSRPITTSRRARSSKRSSTSIIRTCATTASPRPRPSSSIR